MFIRYVVVMVRIVPPSFDKHLVLKMEVMICMVVSLIKSSMLRLQQKDLYIELTLALTASDVIKNVSV